MVRNFLMLSLVGLCLEALICRDHYFVDGSKPSLSSPNAIGQMLVPLSTPVGSV